MLIMGYHKVGLLIAALLLGSSWTFATVTVTAYDDAADAVYNGGIYHLQNGGTGFNAWQTNAFPFGGFHKPGLKAGVFRSTWAGRRRP